jgi:hypothetical protein
LVGRQATGIQLVAREADVGPAQSENEKT